MIFAVLATGPSMSQSVADQVRGRCKVVAVSDAYKLAPWADALVSSDAAWWKANPAAVEFNGPKWSAAPDFRQVAGVERFPSADNGSNSGLLACQVAVSMGAKTILLCGFDMRGSHFFGPHQSPLKNTQPARFEVFHRQFARFRPRGVTVLNCTPGSALKHFQMADLEDALAARAMLAA
jgi:hypothetical protein